MNAELICVTQQVCGRSINERIKGVGLRSA